jgi:hypothetical protein
MPAFSYSGLCYSDASSALQAYKADFPKVEANSILSMSSNPLPAVTVNGQVSASVTRQDLTKNLGNNNPQTYATTFQLAQCNLPNADFNGGVSAGFFAFGFVGVMLLYFSSHAIGLVVKAVKNF